MTDYRTLAIVDALTSLGVELAPWQVEALDRMMLAEDDDDEDAA
jgi:hypothetical protein